MTEPSKAQEIRQALESLPPLREVIRAHGLSADKRLGQNFLLDLNLTNRIARAAGAAAGCPMVEIGPGPGGLTRMLLAEGAHVVAVEQDARFEPVLASLTDLCPDRFAFVMGDALHLPLAQALEKLPQQERPKVVGNLPYNIASLLLVKWLLKEPWPTLVQSFTLMFQREVAERLVAVPGTKAYGRLSVISQWRTRPRILFDIPPAAFSPPPKVTSTLVRLEVRDTPLAPADPHRLERVLAAAFGQRRKMLRQSLKGLIAAPTPFLEALGLEPTARAETLSVEDFCRITEALPTRGPEG